MRIIFYEIKKIYNAKIVLILMVFCALFYAAVMREAVQNYAEDAEIAADIAFCTELTRRYGIRITPENLEEFYAAHMSADLTEESARALEYMRTRYYQMTDDVVDKIINPTETAVTPLYRSRAATSLRTDEYLSAVPWRTMPALFDYTQSFAIMLIVALLVLLSPLLVTDNIRKMRQLQYSSKQGRNLLGKQFAAALISAFVLTSVLIAIFGAIYAATGAFNFWNCYISAFNSFLMFALPLTLGQYVLMIVGMMYVFALGLAALIFTLSRFCANYIALIAGAVVIGVAAVNLSGRVIFEAPFNSLAFDANFALIQPLVCVAVFAAAWLAAMVVIRRERKVDAL